MVQRRKRAEWIEIVRSWRASGETAEDYAKRRGVNAGTMKWWGYRLPKDTEEESSIMPVGQLIEVVASPTVSVVAKPSPLRLEIGHDITMIFDTAPSAAFLADFVTAVTRGAR